MALHRLVGNLDFPLPGSLEIVITGCFGGLMPHVSLGISISGDKSHCGPLEIAIAYVGRRIKPDRPPDRCLFGSACYANVVHDSAHGAAKVDKGTAALVFAPLERGLKRESVGPAAVEPFETAGLDHQKPVVIRVQMEY